MNRFINQLMTLSRFAKTLWRRAVVTSKTDFALGILAWVAKLYITAWAVWMGGSKYAAWDPPTKFSFWLLVTTMLYAGSQPYFPRRGSKKNDREGQARARDMALAISELTMAVWKRELSPASKQEILRQLLNRIKVEVENIVADMDRVSIRVTLLVEDRNNHAKVREIAQVDQMKVFKSYLKTELPVTEVLKTHERFYDGDCRRNSKGEGPRAILGLPLISTFEEENVEQTIITGIVSIESQDKAAFDGFGSEIEMKVLPHLGLIKLTLTADDALKGSKRP